jgi:CubicO group peptidase (beta-lactamase class C family)
MNMKTVTLLLPLRLSIGVLILLITCMHSFVNAQTGIGVPSFHACDSLVQAFITKWSIPGATVALAKDGKLVYMRGFGVADRVGNEVTQPYHMFRLASVSKPITAIAIMKLMEGGFLSLDDHVFGPGGILNSDPYIAGATISDTRIYDVTIRNCLEHTTGWNREVPMVPNPPPPYTSTVGMSDPKEFPLYVTSVLGESNPVTAKQMIKFILQRGLDYTPGTQWHYGNMEYCILARIIEQLTGMSYEQYVTSAILEPLGIYDTHLGKSLLVDKMEREGEYSAIGNILSSFGTGQIVNYQYGGLNIESADGFAGWISTARDLVRLIVAVDGFSTKPDILTSASIDTMTTPSALNGNCAKGWFIDAPGVWEHNGDYPGHQAYVMRNGGGFVWAMIVNRREYNTSGSQLGDLIALSNNCIAATSSYPTFDLLDFPIQNAGNISFSDIKAQAVTVNWTNGNGNGRLLLAREATPVSKFPIDGTSYTADNAFGNVSLGSGNYIVYSGNGNSVTVNNLIPGKKYHFRLFEFNKNDTTGNYALYQLGKSERDSIQTPLADSVGVVSNMDTSLCGQAVTFTATVALIAPVVGTPTGTVTFKSGATTIGTAPIDGLGNASVSVPIYSVGDQEITARYAGNGSFNADTSSPLNHTVTQAGTSTSLTSDVSPSPYGHKVSLMATIAALPPGGGKAGGIVTFTEAADTLGTGVLNDSAVATLAIIGLSIGNHSMTATYDGDANYTGSASTSFEQEVTEFHLAVQGGWNMISSPFIFGDYGTFVLFPTAISEAFAYQGHYVSASDIANGRGVWLRFDSAQSVTLNGAVLAIDSIHVLPGWNMIGSISTSVSAGQVTSNPPGMSHSVFYTYDGTQYVVASEIEPGKAYWVKVSEEGELVFSASSAGMSSFTHHNVVAGGELPPPPPSGETTDLGTSVPGEFRLEQNYPNPFNPTTIISYGLPEDEHVKLTIINTLGQTVRVLVDAQQTAGYKQASFDARDVPSGVYFYRLQAGIFSSIRKMLLLK